MADRLIVKGAREHNLRGVDLDLPRDALIVFTGLSGSGKSSLAFDTIFAEGQRRYVESLSAYARQFLGQMDKPDVDFIEGLSPAVSIDQKSTNRNPRSTVGTITEVYDYLRLLYARAGTPHCPVCGERIARQTPQQIVDQVLAMPEGNRFLVLAPVVRTRKGEFADLFEKLNAQGYSRVRVDGVVHSLTDPPKLKKQEKHDIEVVVDRLTVKATAKQRLTDSVETALNLADGIVVLEFVDHEPGAPHREQRFSEKLACPNGHALAVDDLEPRSFSFNSPYGACPECTGLGIRKEVDPDLVVPDPELTLAQGAVAPWSMGHTAEYFTRMMAGLGDSIGFNVDTPWRKLPAKARKAILEGCDEQVHVRYRNRYGRTRSYYADFEGVLAFLQRKMSQTESDMMKERYEGFMRDVPCPVCDGTRLKPEILAVTLAGGRGSWARNPSPRFASCPSPSAPSSCGDSPWVHASMRSRARCSRKYSRGWAFCSTSGSNICRCPARRPRCPAVRRNGSGWPPRSAPGWWVCCTCSTSRPSACTSATIAGSSKPLLV